MAKAKLPELVHVTWLDAHSEDSWTPKSDLQFKPTECFTVGYLVKKTKKTLSVAGSAHGVGKDIDYACVMTIPCGCIVKVKKLS